MLKNIDSKFEAYTLSYAPFPWEIEKNHDDKTVINKPGIVVSYERYRRALHKLDDFIKPNCRIIDFGIYPGCLAKVIKEFYPEISTYNGIGLGFSENFTQEMANINIKLCETELDPDYFSPKAVNPVPDEFKNADLALFMDIIEHLVNPFDALNTVYDVLADQGICILTTDNVTALSNCIRAALNGISSNVPPVRTHLYYRGDWRPHFREYAKSDLLFILGQAGFKILHHEYFSRFQGDFEIKNGNLIQHRRYAGMKGWVMRNVEKRVPHLKDHQLVILRKDKSLPRWSRDSITDNMEDWFKFRKRFDH